MKERFQLRSGLYSHFKINCIAFFFPVNSYLGEARLLCLRSFPCLLRCHCEQYCNDMNLVGALEFRSCREVVHSSGKHVFDGSIHPLNLISLQQNSRVQVPPLPLPGFLHGSPEFKSLTLLVNSCSLFAFGQLKFLTLLCLISIICFNLLRGPNSILSAINTKEDK